MAKALAPAYVRIGGPRSNSYIFHRGLYPQDTQIDPGYTFSGKLIQITENKNHVI
jgi:expansin (peptidoglycan-binding protein)